MRSGSIFRFQFSSAHFYAQKNWSEEKNRSEFGKCFTPHGHGHNYVLECEIPFTLDSKEASEFKSQTQNVVSKLDHEHLNFTIPEFKEHVPTTENIARYIFEKIKPYSPLALTIKLFEMEDLWVTIQS